MNKTYSFSGVSVSAEYSHRYCANHFSGYETDLPPRFAVSVKQTDIDAERTTSTSNFSDGYLESLAFLRKLSTDFAPMGILLFHASAIEFEGKAYLYTAVSGTGKSTHSALCKQVFGDRVRYINDDKPFLRFDNGCWTVYGSPWNGKHRLGNNISAPLGGIAILKRGSENSIRKVTGDYALPTLFLQSYRPEDPVAMQNVLDLVVNLSKMPIYELFCNISQDAARLSLGTMSGIEL